MADYAVARRNMVDTQIRTNKVTDGRVISAFLDVPRERFLPPELQPVAYLDEDLAIGGGRHLMEPRVMSRMLQMLAIDKNDVVLDIGCGTGYSSALIAHLAATVVVLESDSAFVARANENFTALGIDNVAVVEGALAEGYPSQAPYDVIFIGGAVPEIPTAIAEQLAEGGRLGAVVTGASEIAQTMLVTRRNGLLSARPVFDASVPELPGFSASKEFVF